MKQPIELKVDHSRNWFTDEKLGNILHNAGAQRVYTLKEGAKLCTPFLYDRRYGVMSVEFAHHCFLAATLLAFDLGYEHWSDIPMGKIPKEYSPADPQELADWYYQRTPGSAFYTHCGMKDSSKVYTWCEDSLNAMEKRLFGGIRYISTTR